jgi:hypothetical protein
MIGYILGFIIDIFKTICYRMSSLAMVKKTVDIILYFVPDLIALLLTFLVKRIKVVNQF